MEDSVLISTKKILGFEANYHPFDHDIIIHINSALSTLSQLGVGPATPFVVEDESLTWSSMGFPLEQLSMAKNYVYLKTRLLFDPPSTSFVIEAMNKQISELEWRMNVFREASTNG